MACYRVVDGNLYIDSRQEAHYNFFLERKRGRVAGKEAVKR